VCREGREKEVQKKLGLAEQERTEQNAVCVFRIKERPIVDFPGRYLSDSPRHSWRHLRFSILRKKTRPLDTYYALQSSSSSPSSPSSPPRSSLMSASSRLSVSILRELSHSSCAGPEKSNEALVGSTNVYRPRGPVANAIRKSTRWCPGDYPRDRPGWSGALFRFFNDLLTYYDRHG